MIGSILGFLSNFHTVVDRFTPKVSLDTFFESISDGIDEFIKDAKKDRYHFLGGKTFFSLDDKRLHIIIKVQLFFQVPGAGFKRLESEGEYLFDLLKSEAKEEFYDCISDNGVYVVEVEE